MENLTVSLIQANLKWKNKQANLEAFSRHIDSIQETTNLIILPEMFTTGFTMDAKEMAEDMSGYSVEWMSMKAKEQSAIVSGSLIIIEKGFYYNRFIWMRPDGSFECYDKRHLFAMAGEHKHYTPGTQRLKISEKSWRICPMICYDLRFPVWSRNQDEYDLLIYVANWPDKRSYDWKLLLQARAVENQSYVIGVNRIGKDDLGNLYSGDSMIVDPAWRKTLYHNEGREEVFTYSLSYEHLVKIRKDLPFLLDQDKFSITS